MNKKFISFFLIVFLYFFSNFVYCAENEIKPNNIDNNDETSKVFEDFLKKQEEFYPGQDFMGGYQDAMFKMLQSQLKMLEVLPEECRQNVIETWELLLELTDKLQDPMDFLCQCCNKSCLNVQNILDSQQTKDKDLELFSNTLKDILNFINSGDLLFSLELELTQRQARFYDKQNQTDLNSLFKEFDNQIENICKKYPLLEKDLDFLYESLFALKNKDLKTLSAHKLESIKPEVDAAVEKLNNAQKLLDNLGKNLKEADKDLKEAIEFWQESLKKFDPLKNGIQDVDFVGQESRASKWLSAFTKLVPYIKNGYLLYNNIFRLFKYDNNGKDLYKFSLSKLLKLQFVDAFKINLKNNNLNKSLFLGAFVLDKAWGTLLIPLNMLEAIKGKTSYSSYESLYFKQMMWQFIATCQILIYYNTLHKYFLQDGESLEGFSLPSDYKPFQKMSWEAIKSFSDLGAHYLERGVRAGFDQDSLDKVENNSLGIIRPELIKFYFDTTLPILAYRYFPKNIVNFKKEMVFKPEPFDWYYVGKTDFKNMSDAQYIENRILGYLSVSLGYHFGKSIAYRNRGFLKNILGKIGKFLLVKTGIIEKEIIEKLPQYKEVVIEEITFLLQEKEDPMFVIAKQMFLAFLVQFGAVKKMDVDELELAIEKDIVDDKILSNFADKIVSNIADNIVKQVGGGLGAWGSWHLANAVTQKYGPFFATAAHA